MFLLITFITRMIYVDALHISITEGDQRGRGILRVLFFSLYSNLSPPTRFDPCASCMRLRFLRTDAILHDKPLMNYRPLQNRCHLALINDRH